MKPIYLDYNATTPIAQEVKEEIIKNLDIFGNPSSSHSYGQIASGILERSRDIIAHFIDANSEEILFTSCGTEGNNTILNLSKMDKFSGRVITTEIEHASISESLRILSKSDIEVIKLSVNSLGFIDLDELRDIVKEDDLVSIIFANNEIGTIQDVDKISKIVKSSGAYLHLDATQALGKIPISVKELNVDYLTASAHKIYGPKGIGFMYVKKRVPFTSYIVGGEQEFEKRAGTQNPLLASAFAKAIELRKITMIDEQERLFKIKFNTIKSLSEIEGLTFNGALDKNGLAGTINFTLTDIENDLLLLYLDMANISVSTGSACSSTTFKASSVLKAIGLNEADAFRTIRISMGAYTTKEQMERVVDEIKSIVKRVRDRRG